MESLNTTMLRIHSFESAGTVDGPGIRFVVFMQGCPLRCQYCHNPDTWDIHGGRTISAKEMVQEILKYENFMHFSNGGVTFSGGEPLLQKKALLPVFSELKKQHIHIAIDTAGTTDIDETTVKLLEHVDLVMLDVKHLASAEHKKLTGLPNNRTFDFLSHLKKEHIPTWIRWVVVPDFNDTEEYAQMYADFVKQYPNVELVEILPYHQHGVYKWKQLNIPYPLENTPEPSKILIEKLARILEQNGIPTLYAK